jgi:hypothetical protein
MREPLRSTELITHEGIWSFCYWNFFFRRVLLHLNLQKYTSGISLHHRKEDNEEQGQQASVSPGCT